MILYTKRTGLRETNPPPSSKVDAAYATATAEVAVEAAAVARL
jgi:hypothetical protein